MSTYRDQLIEIAKAKQALEDKHTRERHRGSLMEFIRDFWHILEPGRRMTEGWVMEAICEHLEAITRGEFNKFLCNVPPGCAKSLIVNVFWPAWEWGPQDLAHLRYLSFSYSTSNTERDNRRFLDIVSSELYQRLYPHVALRKVGEVLVSNGHHGWKMASSVSGTSTGARADRVLFDDPHNVKFAESEVIRKGTVRWFREGMSNRLNDLGTSAIVVIMQRVHEDDVSGEILEHNLPYVWLMVPMEFESDRKFTNEHGWTDPRTYDGELAWPDRFPAADLLEFKSQAYTWAGQYQQRPELRDAALFKREWWNIESIPFGKSPPQPTFVVASLDSAYTKNERNDPSGFSVWGAVPDKQGNNRLFCYGAWRKHLELHGPTIEREPNELPQAYKDRCRPHWGLVEWVTEDCERLKVDVLLIENKASGKSVEQEFRRLFAGRNFAVRLVDPEGDKWARAVAQAHLWADGAIWVPGSPSNQDDPNSGYMPRDWAQVMIDEMAAFPNGRFRDITDSVTQAMKYLRAMGLAVRREERQQMDLEQMRYRKPLPPIYPDA